MKKKWLNFIRLKHHPSSPKNHPLGLSLVELIISMFLGVVATSLLLNIMVEGMTYNQREQSLSQVNEEMKQALDYIAKDLREAIYVYNGQELKTRANDEDKGLENFIPDFGDDTRPILAFWKIEPLSEDELESVDCSSFTDESDADQLNECQALRIERRTYTLVVYVQTTNNSDSDSDEWKGESRIERYQLRKYSDLSDLTRTTGYVDPVSEANFAMWPYQNASDTVDQQSERPTVTDNDPARETLVDFVAAPSTLPDIAITSSEESEENAPILEEDLSCYIKTNPPDDPTLNYIASPLSNTEDALSFFACVKNNEQSSNQDVLILLRGNAKGKPGIEEDSLLPLLRAQVLIGGVYDKVLTD